MLPDNNENLICGCGVANPLRTVACHRYRNPLFTAFVHKYAERQERAEKRAIASRQNQARKHSQHLILGSLSVSLVVII